MDYDTVSADAFGASLRGMGVNLLVRDVQLHCSMLSAVFDMTAHQISADFAILRYGTAVFQLHADGTYSANPYLGLLPENPPRGAGAELRLYDTDPDVAAARAEDHGMTILQPPTDKPHGLRECYLLCPDGYAWVPSRPLDGAATR
ncbi:VOC family protein [Thalassococcus lentus]|uniref:Glyoxalase n=1 Tax=Thalassococcus lentus TaxID=1210524 RepID=A0ABT4XUW4_9RHOB|nr:glyoxalase [Thalassococcus lentus]MDA7425739.1 glyoxalase [Thalassococcus lentus]